MKKLLKISVAIFILLISLIGTISFNSCDKKDDIITKTDSIYLYDTIYQIDTNSCFDTTAIFDTVSIYDTINCSVCDYDYSSHKFKPIDNGCIDLCHQYSADSIKWGECIQDSSKLFNIWQLLVIVDLENCTFDTIPRKDLESYSENIFSIRFPQEDSVIITSRVNTIKGHFNSVKNTFSITSFMRTFAFNPEFNELEQKYFGAFSYEECYYSIFNNNLIIYSNDGKYKLLYTLIE